MRHNSKHFFGSLRIAAAALFAMAVSSCQTEPAKPVETGTYSASIPPIVEEYRQPDLVTWKIGSDTGSAAVTGGGSVVQIQLKEKVSGDVWLDLWRSGVRIMQLKYVRNTETTLEYASEKREDALAREIFRQILPSKDSIIFAKKLAEQVVSSDSVNRSTEQAIALMVGVNRDTLVAEALRIMAQSGNPIDKFLPQGRDSLLGHSIESIHVQVKILVELKVIVTDTNALFPPPPVRVVSNLAMPEQLQAGGDASGVTGKFEATGKIATLIAKVYQDTLDVSRHFEIPQIDLTNRPKDLDLDGKLWVTAKSSAAAGTYRLEVVVVDADPTPNSIKAVVGFKVIPAADVVGPAIEIQSPAPNTVLENDVATVSVKASVEDPSGVDSVWISDKLAVGVDGIWSLASVEIPVTDIGFAVVVRAKDGKGNVSSKDILVGRKAKLDPGAPSWTVLSPKANEVFMFDSSSVAVRWKVSDPRAEIAKAWIGGAEAAKDADGIWVRRVELPATGALTTVTLVAVNAKGDSVQGFIQVTRQADTKGPMIQIKSPVDGMVFGYDAPSVLVMIAATDPSGVDSVKVNGKPANPISAEYVYNLAMEAGKEIVILVEAWDKLKNSSTDTIKISRKGAPDTTAPRLKLLGPASGTELSIDTKTATLRWLVTDLLGVPDTEVKIDGKVAQRSADTFSLEVAAPAPGREESHRIDVKNIKGVSNFETMSLKRAKDVTAPKLVRVDSGRTVLFENEKATVSWKVTDNYKLGSVTIAGKNVTGVDGLYSQEVALATGDNRIAIVATDSANNSSSDTVTVHRTWKDTSKPSLVRQTGTENKNVPFATTDFTASWKVTDNALSTVTINGAVITSADGIYSLKATLAAASTKFKIEAKDAANNSKVDSITVTKSDDLTDPVVARLPGTKDTTVPYATSTYALGWEVIDESGVASVSVSGVPATKSGDNYRLTVSLPKVGLNEFLMVAKDVAGNESYDTIRIHRAYHDSIAPQRVRGVNTKDTTVPYGTAKYTLSWTVTDNDVVKSVTIGGGVALFSQGVYSREVNLVAGPNKFGMLATDTAGNTVTDTVVITVAADGAAPVISRETGTKDSTVAYGVTSITLKWKITDDVGVTSVTVNDVAVQTATNSVYSYTLTSLKFGANGVKVVAKDAAGKTRTDTLTITRKNDVSAPSIVRQSGTKDSAVAYEKTTHSLSWKVTDDNGLASVKVNGTTLQSSAGIYTFPISGLVIGTNGFKLIATDVAGKTSSDSVTITRKLGVLPELVFSHAAGNHDSILHVRITCSHTEALIKYTLDGSEPSTSATAMLYSTALLVDQSRIIKAYAFADGYASSATVSRSYSLITPAPTTDIPSGTRADTAFSVKLYSKITGASIYYTTDGSTPIEGVSDQFFAWSDPVLIDSIRTLRAIAVRSGWSKSNIMNASFIANVPVKVYSGYASMVILADGSLWTSGSAAQLADGSVNDRSTFAKVMENVSDVAEGLILRKNGEVYGFGYNHNGQLGIGSESSVTEPVYTPVLIRKGVKAIAGSESHTLLLDSAGRLYAAGRNSDGAYCNGTYTKSLTPVVVQTDVASMTAGYFSAPGASYAWTLFVKNDGSAYSCGSEYLGTGMDRYRKNMPQHLGEGYRLALASSGSMYGGGSFLLKTDNALLATASHYVKYFVDEGDYPRPSDSLFVKIMSSVKYVAAQFGTLFYVDFSGDAYGVGSNSSGEVGDGTTSEVIVPTVILRDVKSVFTGRGKTFFIKKDGTLWVTGGGHVTPTRITLP